MQETITFNDVLIKPKFSAIESRKDVDLSQNIFSEHINLPIISANMDSVTGKLMGLVMRNNGAQACLHRFWNIKENVDAFKCGQTNKEGPWVSIGLGVSELERAESLFSAGAKTFVLDVANGASISVVNQVRKLHELFQDNAAVIVGNFATGEAIETFLHHSGNIFHGVKVNIGAGSVCTTRLKTGVGIPQLSAILDASHTLKNTGILIIADGGMNNVGDCAKALGAGAHMLMSGSFFSGCDETPGDVVWKDPQGNIYTNQPKDYYVTLDNKELKQFKKYRGSASYESYIDQGKVASWRCAEGETLYVPYKGSVKDVLQEIEGGLRSAFTYTNSRNLSEFHKNVEFVRVSGNTVIENGIRNGVKW